MKLKEYAIYINDLARHHPNAEVVYASDDEGNNFQPVHYHPTVGMMVDNREFYDKLSAIKLFKKKAVNNAICIN